MKPKDEAPRRGHGQRIARQLSEAGLWLAAEAHGAEIPPGDRPAVDAATVSESEILDNILRIAEITEDPLLAERVRQRMKYAGLKRDLSPAVAGVLDIYAERFYSFWDEGKQVFVQSEMTDFPEWYNRAANGMEEIFDPKDMETVLAMSCAKEQMKRAPLLRRLLRTAADSEAIRIGYLYPVRETAFEIFTDLLTKLKELLLIRELHNTAFQLGEHPEELIPYVWANILKCHLNANLPEALAQINMLAYIHCAAQQTESKITGSDAYTKLKKDFVLFNRETQRTWPNEVRKLFLDPAIVEALNRYRFTHGLLALNVDLAFRYADRGEGGFIEEREEDDVVFNGLILTRTGYVKSSGFDDGSVKNQFLRDVGNFRSLIDGRQSLDLSAHFHWHRQIRSRRKNLAGRLEGVIGEIDAIREAVSADAAEMEALAARIGAGPVGGGRLGGLLKKREAGAEKPGQRLSEIVAGERGRLERLAEIRRLLEETRVFIDDINRMLA